MMQEYTVPRENKNPITHVCNLKFRKKTFATLSSRMHLCQELFASNSISLEEESNLSLSIFLIKEKYFLLRILFLTESHFSLKKK